MTTDCPDCDGSGTTGHESDCPAPEEDIPGSVASLLQTIEQPLWMEHAACRTAGPLPFYPEPLHRADLAREYCDSCPVVDDCLIHAVVVNETHGVWGGCSPRERRRVRKVWVLTGEIKRENETIWPVRAGE